MVIRKEKQKKILVGAVSVFLVVAMFMVFFKKDKVTGISYACSLSATCREAAEREQEAKKQAEAASNSASLYQSKVNELNLQVASMQSVIADTEAQVGELTRQINETEAKLKAEQEALAELLVNIHFESDAEPITILAGANSISDLAEKQARNEVVKEQISLTAIKVKEAKVKLEEDRVKVEELLAQQKYAKAELERMRAEQEELVRKYKNDVASYEAMAKEASETKQAAEEEIQRQHPELFGGIAVYSGSNTYPWQGDCPGRADTYGTMINGRYIGGYVCECVSYAGWKAYERYGLILAWGNANTWDNWARALGYRVDRTPEAGTIGQTDNGSYGHVFWVESVNADGSINVTEYNNMYATRNYTGSYHMHDFGTRVISAAQVKQFNYIHLR
ncbi:MAG: CHAP domain-containing protein [Candidatus Saccharibacteria bacterium]|nr:CHAP domain-containing protein [Candidatus Saccharibacteria bacterium]